MPSSVLPPDGMEASLVRLIAAQGWPCSSGALCFVLCALLYGLLCAMLSVCPALCAVLVSSWAHSTHFHLGCSHAEDSLMLHHVGNLLPPSAKVALKFRMNEKILREKTLAHIRIQLKEPRTHETEWAGLGGPGFP